MTETKISLKGYSDWVRKNVFTVIGIIIILSLVLWNASTIDKQKVEIADSCNEYWRIKMVEMCPLLAEDGGWMSMDMSEFDEKE